jgi:putative ABC transport system permease protein
MHQWPQSFAYRIPIGPSVFMAAGGLTLLLALLTISIQSTRAALTNPADSLRYE